MNLREELYQELENDPFGLLDVKPKQSTHRDEVKMIIESFQNILAFYKKMRENQIKTHRDLREVWR